jgi:lipid A 3-O-deacylase
MFSRFKPALAGVVVACLTIAAGGISAVQAQSLRTTDASGFGATPFPYIDELRTGVLTHQLGGDHYEHGTDVNAEILFGKIGAPRGDYLLDYLLRPRVHLGADINTSGDTSQGYFGLTWDAPLGKRFFVETSFGGAVHDGHLDKTPEHSGFGCRVNFHESASLGVHLTERWNLMATIDHMSNAGLCSENRGLSNAGLRLGYKW